MAVLLAGLLRVGEFLLEPLRNHVRLLRQSPGFEVIHRNLVLLDHECSVGLADELRVHRPQSAVRETQQQLRHAIGALELALVDHVPNATESRQVRLDLVVRRAVLCGNRPGGIGAIGERPLPKRHPWIDVDGVHALSGGELHHAHVVRFRLFVGQRSDKHFTELGILPASHAGRLIEREVRVGLRLGKGFGVSLELSLLLGDDLVHIGGCLRGRLGL